MCIYMSICMCMCICICICNYMFICMCICMCNNPSLLPRAFLQPQTLQSRERPWGYFENLAMYQFWLKMKFSPPLSLKFMFDLAVGLKSQKITENASTQPWPQAKPGITPRKGFWGQEGLFPGDLAIMSTTTKLTTWFRLQPLGADKGEKIALPRCKILFQPPTQGDWICPSLWPF